MSTPEPPALTPDRILWFSLSYQGLSTRLELWLVSVLIIPGSLLLLWFLFYEWSG